MCLVRTNFQSITGVLLSQRDAGEMAALTLLFTITLRARGQSVPLDTDGGNKTAREELSGTREGEAGSEECKKKI